MSSYFPLTPRDPKLEDLREEFGLPEAQVTEGFFGVRLWDRHPDEHGARLKVEQWFPNIVTTTGKNMLAGYFTGGAAGGFAINLGIGTGSTQPAVGDTTLTTEVGTRVSAGRAITANTALRLARYFGTSPDVWLGLQARYDLDLARAKLGRRIEREVDARVTA